jgi:hypothetical protein
LSLLGVADPIQNGLIQSLQKQLKGSAGVIVEPASFHHQPDTLYRVWVSFWRR